MAKWSSQHNGKFPDPYAKLKFDKEEKKKDKKKKKQKKEKADREKENVNKQIDPNKVRYKFVNNTFFVQNVQTQLWIDFQILKTKAHGYDMRLFWQSLIVLTNAS